MGKTWLREGGTGWEYAQREGGRYSVGRKTVQKRIDITREDEQYSLSHYQQRRSEKRMKGRGMVPL